MPLAGAGIATAGFSVSAVTDTMKQKRPFRAGGTSGASPQFTEPYVLLADVSEFQPDITDAAYLEWSKAIVVRALYGASHDDAAWYGGERRTLLHQGGARFLGIYQYLVSGQSGTMAARAFRQLVGAIQPGEVFIADAEEVGRTVLTDWYNAMIAMYGQEISPYLWTYTGEDFGEQQGLLPVEFIAAYGQPEPVSPHILWQFTDSYQVPGAGVADCSVYHGTISELAALAYQPLVMFGPPQNLTVRPGDGSVLVERCDPPAVAPGPVDHYEITVYTGSYPSEASKVASYPRYMRAAPDQFGRLDDIPSKTHMTCRAVAYTADGQVSQYADVHFEMP